MRKTCTPLLLAGLLAAAAALPAQAGPDEALGKAGCVACHALDKRVVYGLGDRRHELPVRSFSREKRGVFLQSADRNRSGNGFAHGRAVVKETTRRLRADLRLIVHARVEMDGRTARRAAARAAADGKRGEHERAQHRTSFDRELFRAIYAIREQRAR